MSFIKVIKASPRKGDRDLSKTARLQMAQTFAEPAVQKYMLQLIIQKIFHAIDVLGNIVQRNYTITEKPLAIFEWGRHHFKQRMETSADYIDALLRREKPGKLEGYKLLIDIKNLKWHLQQLAEGQVAAAHVSLLGCRKLLNIRQEIDLQYAKNTEEIKRLENYVSNLDRVELQATKEQNDLLHATMDRCMHESLVVLPIHFRCDRNYQRAHFDIIEHKLLQREEELENSKTEYYETIKTNNYVLSSVLDHLNGKIQAFKTDIQYWTDKYEEEFDTLSNEVDYSKLRLKALELQWKESRERIEFYRAEVRRIQEEDLLINETKAAQLAAEEDERRSSILRQQKEKKKKLRSKSQKK